MESPPIVAKVVHLSALVIATLVYCVMAVRPRSPGLPRFLAALPAFAVFSLCPAIVSESLVLSGCAGLTLMWVASFKLLAYTGGRGALAHPAVARGSAWQWAALLVLPFFPTKSGRRPASGSGTHAFLGVLLKLGLWLGLNAVLLAPPGSMAPAVRHVCYAVYMWMFVSLCLDAATPLSGQLLQGVPLQPAMDAPYAATSVREFWGRRYNQIVSATLLETVYKPIVQGRWVVPEAAGSGSEPRAAEEGKGEVVSRQAPAGPEGGGGNVAVRAGPPPAAQENPRGGSGGADATAATAPPAQEQEQQGKQRGRRTSTSLALTALGASFLVSGIMHEIVIAIMCGFRLEGSFRMTAFFLLQPLLILAQETAVWALLPKATAASDGNNSGNTGSSSSSGGRSRAVSLVQTAVTLALVLSSAELFWASLESCDIDQRGLREVMGAVQWTAERVRQAGWLRAVAA